MAGYIKLHRGWHKSDFFRQNEPYCQRAAWVWLLENAAWKDGERRDAKGNIVPIKRGQLHTSTRALGGVFGWSKNKSERFLRDLEKCKMLDRKAGRNGVLLTICKYTDYQGDGDTGGPQEGAQTDHRRTTQEEGKERKEDKNSSDFAFSGRVVRLNFSDFRNWQLAYPDLDLRAQLTSRDAYLNGQPQAEQKRWFISTAAWLANKQQDALTASRQSESSFIC